ncbi:hypothetical protein C0214_23920 [Methylobacterium sp. DM1]|nr:hypothetical protein C0214_23920 [Methylobacterium sp. DM1]
MEDHAELFDFVSFVLIDGDDVALRAFDRALDQILRSNQGNSTAPMHYTGEAESLFEAFAVTPS